MKEQSVRWIVTRVVEEKMEIWAQTEKEALDKSTNPYSVKILSESAKKAKKLDVATD
jgi:hypothetical protein